VPETIALVGAGNVHYSDLLRVPLSTVDQSSSVIGESAAELLLQVIESKRQRSPKAILIDARLIVRDSSLRHGASL
jgi:LacI family transcriptional regulator